jgi:hypothetical protein
VIPIAFAVAARSASTVRPSKEQVINASHIPFSVYLRRTEGVDAQKPADPPKPPESATQVGGTKQLEAQRDKTLQPKLSDILQTVLTNGTPAQRLPSLAISTNLQTPTPPGPAKVEDTGEPGTVAIPKALGKQSPQEPRSKAPQNEAPVLFLAHDQQPQPILLNLSSFLIRPQEQSSGGKQDIEAGANETNLLSASPTDARAATSLNPVAFTVNLQKAGAFEQQNIDATSSWQSQSSIAEPSEQLGNGSSNNPNPDTSSSDKHAPPGPKIEAAKEASQDVVLAAHSDPQALPGPAMAGGYQATSSNPQRTEKGTADTKPAVPNEPAATRAPSSPQHIDLRLPSDDGRHVDVRISQRAGDVQMTVRTPDGELAQSLRKHLPELSENLTQNGLKGEFFHTGMSQSSDTPQNSSQQSSQQSPENNPPAKKHGPKDQKFGSFAQMIQTEKGSN